MTPLTQDPQIVILYNKDTGEKAIATNIDPDVNVKVTDNATEFMKLAQGLPFLSN